MEDRSEIVQKFDSYKLSVENYIRAIMSLKVAGFALNEMMPTDAEEKENDDGKQVIISIPLQKVEDQSSIVQLLTKYLNPFYRKLGMSTAPRLIGYIIWDGTREQLNTAAQKHQELNDAKKAWADELKAQFPDVAARQRYLNKTPEFKGMSSRSVHRRLYELPKGGYSVKFSWASKSVRGEEISLENDLKNIIARYMPNSTAAEQEAKYQIAERRCSPDKSKFKLIHRFPIRIHPVLTVYYKEGEERKRQPLRPGLPIMVYGIQKLRTNEFDSYDINDKQRQPNNKRFIYYPILPEFGIYQSEAIDKQRDV